MSIVSTIKDFFKKPEVGGVLLTCAAVVVGAVYDGIKAKNNDNKEEGDGDMANKELEELIKNESANTIKKLSEIRKKRFDKRDPMLVVQVITLTINVGAQIIGVFFNAKDVD